MSEQQPNQDTNHIKEDDELQLNEEANQESAPAGEDEDIPQGTSESPEYGDANQGESGELEKLRTELEEQKQRTLRAQADFDNFRRRTVKEKEELGKYASAKLITELLPVIDNFERALNTGSEGTANDSYTKGIEMIYRQLENVLRSEGLTKMEVVGQSFNPEYHQAVMQVESDEHEEGIIVEELQSGYLLKDKVLRPAMVKVSG